MCLKSRGQRSSGRLVDIQSGRRSRDSLVIWTHLKLHTEGDIPQAAASTSTTVTCFLRFPECQFEPHTCPSRHEDSLRKCDNSAVGEDKQKAILLYAHTHTHTFLFLFLLKSFLSVRLFIIVNNLSLILRDFHLKPAVCCCFRRLNMLLLLVQSVSYRQEKETKT